MPEETDDTPALQKFTRTVAVSWRTFRLVWGYEKGLLMLSVLLNTTPSVLPFINAYIYKLIIDEVVHYVSSGTLDQAHLYSLFGIRLISYFVQDFSFRLQNFVSHHLWTRIPIALQDLILTKISNLDIQYFEDSEFKNLLEKARDGLDYRPQGLISSIMGIFSGIITLSIATVALAQLSPYLIILLILIAVPEFIVQTKLSKQAWGIWSWKSPKKKRYWNLVHLLQDPRSIKETKLYNVGPKFLRDLHDIQVEFYGAESGHEKKRLGFNSFFNMLSACVYVGMEIYAIRQVFRGRITVGDIGFYTSVVGSFQSGLSGLMHSIGSVYDASLYLESLFQILDTPPIVVESPHPIRLVSDKPPLIEFRNVDFVYPGTDAKVLDSFSLTIQPGEKIAFVGENGAGKSTIIKLLARLYDVTAGEIRVNGHNLKDLSIQDWHACIGVLFQDFNRYDYTVKENIWYGKVTAKPRKNRIEKAARDAAAHELIHKFTDGYDQMLGRTFDDGVEPSGGQWQKIALARAFFRDAPILVLDEPTASIDAKAESEIFDRVEDLAKGRTTVIISHRFSTVRKADTIYVIEHGKIVENGSHAELMKLGGQYAGLFSLQAKGYV